MWLMPYPSYAGLLGDWLKTEVIYYNPFRKWRHENVTLAYVGREGLHNVYMNALPVCVQLCDICEGEAWGGPDEKDVE